MIPSIANLAFIAHFLHFSEKELMAMDFEQINIWVDEAVKLFKVLNTSQKEK